MLASQSIMCGHQDIMIAGAHKHMKLNSAWFLCF